MAKKIKVSATESRLARAFSSKTESKFDAHRLFSLINDSLKEDVADTVDEVLENPHSPIGRMNTKTQMKLDRLSLSLKTVQSDTTYIRRKLDKDLAKIIKATGGGQGFFNRIVNGILGVGAGVGALGGGKALVEAAKSKANGRPKITGEGSPVEPYRPSSTASSRYRNTGLNQIEWRRLEKGRMQIEDMIKNNRLGSLSDLPTLLQGYEDATNPNRNRSRPKNIGLNEIEARRITSRGTRIITDHLRANSPHIKLQTGRVLTKTGPTLPTYNELIFGKNSVLNTRGILRSPVKPGRTPNLPSLEQIMRLQRLFGKDPGLRMFSEPPDLAKLRSEAMLRKLPMTRLEGPPGSLEAMAQAARSGRKFTNEPVPDVKSEKRHVIEEPTVRSSIAEAPRIVVDEPAVERYDFHRDYRPMIKNLSPKVKSSGEKMATEFLKKLHQFNVKFPWAAKVFNASMIVAAIGYASVDVWEAAAAGKTGTEVAKELSGALGEIIAGFATAEVAAGFLGKFGGSIGMSVGPAGGAVGAGAGAIIGAILGYMGGAYVGEKAGEMMFDMIMNNGQIDSKALNASWDKIKKLKNEVLKNRRAKGARPGLGRTQQGPAQPPRIRRGRGAIQKTSSLNPFGTEPYQVASAGDAWPLPSSRSSRLPDSVQTTAPIFRVQQKNSRFTQNRIYNGQSSAFGSYLTPQMSSMMSSGGGMYGDASPWMEGGTYSSGKWTSSQPSGKIQPLIDDPAYHGGMTGYSTNRTSGTGTGSLKGKDRLMKMTYDAYIKAGLNDNQARAMVAEIGRENGFNSDIMFGSHIDPYNRKANVGMLSWQGDRGSKVYAYLQSKNLIGKDGKMIQSQASLDAMAAFSIQEMQSSYPVARKNFLENTTGTYDTYNRTLGKNYIKWRYDDPKYASGHANRDNTYNRITNILKNNTFGKSDSVSVTRPGEISKSAGTSMSFDAKGVIQQQQSVAAIRVKKIPSQVEAALQYAAQKSGLEVVVTSGAQMSIDEAKALGAKKIGKKWYLNGKPVRTGSTRHDENVGAADFKLRDPKTGQFIDMSTSAGRDRAAEFVKYGSQAGLTGWGFGEGYMGKYTMHGGGGKVATWGSGSGWLRDAMDEGRDMGMINPLQLRRDEKLVTAKREIPSGPGMGALVGRTNKSPIAEEMQSKQPPMQQIETVDETEKKGPNKSSVTSGPKSIEEMLGQTSQTPMIPSIRRSNATNKNQDPTKVIPFYESGTQNLPTGLA